MPKMKPTVYIDIHGVLGDFVNEAGRLFDIDNIMESIGDSYVLNYDIGAILNRGRDALENPAQIIEDDVRNRINTVGGDFWANIEPYPWAHDMYNYLNKRFETILLTSPSLDPSCLEGMMRWINKFAGDGCRDFIMCPRKHKHELAQYGCILIDDHPKNVSSFGASGGKGILFQMPWNTEKAKGGFNEVVRVLHEVEKWAEGLSAVNDPPF